MHLTASNLFIVSYLSWKMLALIFLDVTRQSSFLYILIKRLFIGKYLLFDSSIYLGQQFKSLLTNWIRKRADTITLILLLISYLLWSFHRLNYNIIILGDQRRSSDHQTFEGETKLWEYYFWKNGDYCFLVVGWASLSLVASF